jgi:hypothetical protein
MEHPPGEAAARSGLRLGVEEEKRVRVAEFHLGNDIHLVPFAAGQVGKDLLIQEFDGVTG